MVRPETLDWKTHTGGGVRGHGHGGGQEFKGEVLLLGPGSGYKSLQAFVVFLIFLFIPQSVLCIYSSFRDPRAGLLAPRGTVRTGTRHTAATSRSPCPTNKTDQLPPRNRAHLKSFSPSKPSSKASKLYLEAFSSRAGL